MTAWRSTPRSWRAGADCANDPAAVAVRLKAYRDQTAPVLDWYRARGTVHTVDAVGTVDAVSARVRRILGR